MTISAMGKKCVVLGLAMCLVLSSFHEASRQADGSSDLKALEIQGMQFNSKSLEEKETSSSSSSMSRAFETENNSTQSEMGQSSSGAEDVRRAMEVYGFTKQAGSDSDGVSKFGESMDDVENVAGKRKHVEEMERKFKAESMKRQQYESKKRNGGSGINTESLGIGQSGVWRCINQDENGVKSDDDAPIVIPKYDLNDIIEEESTYEGSSKTSSLITWLTEIVEKHKRGLWFSNVKIGKANSTAKTETVEKLKVALKGYRDISARDLVARPDFEEILAMAARYEELSSASVSYISRLATYGTVIKEGFRASQRVQTVQQRVKLLENMAMEKQKNVDAEFELVKALAQKGDMLHVKIFAIKKLVLKLEAEKVEVDEEFEKIVENLSRVLEEASQAYEKYHVVVREWKEEQASVEYSRETIERAEVVWVQFLSTL